MKKLLSISFAFLILLSGIHLSIATHFCGGELAATKVSISGELASCGMEGPVDSCPAHGKQLDTNCCTNKVSVLAVTHNYSPSFFAFKSFAHQLLQVFYIPENLTSNSYFAFSTILPDASPPGNLLASAVSLPKICVFRI